MAEIRTIAVLGAGTMGNGIAHVAARSGFHVLLNDINQAALDRGLATIEKNLGREAAKGRISEAQAGEARERIIPVLDRGALRDCDFAIEAASEQIEVKFALFRELEGILRPEVILA